MSDFKDEVACLAIQKWVLNRLKQENDDLTAEVRAAMAGLYEQGGVKQLAAEWNGKKVGTVSATVKKPVKRLAVTDEHAYFMWASAHGFARTVVDDRAVEAHFKGTGEIPDGCRVEDAPGGFSGISVRFDKEAKDNLDEIMRTTALGDAVLGLIGEAQ